MINPYKRKKDELIFKICPFCGNVKWNFQINVVNALYKCWVCSKGGKVNSAILAMVGNPIQLGSIIQENKGTDEVHIDQAKSFDLSNCGSAIMNDEAVKYFDKRGFNVIDIINWGVLIREHRVIFPLLDGSRIVYYIEKDVRSGAYFYPEGYSKKNIVWVRFANQKKDIILVEGVFDAIQVHKAGFNVMILMGTMIFEKEISLINDRHLNPILFLDSDCKFETYDKLEHKLGHFQVMESFVGIDPSDMAILEIQDTYIDRHKFGLEDRMKLKLNGRLVK